MNRYNNPRALYQTQRDAHDAACAINDHFQAFLACYKRLDDKTWVVEASGITTG
jgi:hypothetical protein